MSIDTKESLLGRLGMARRLVWHLLQASLRSDSQARIMSAQIKTLLDNEEEIREQNAELMDEISNLEDEIARR